MLKEIKGWGYITYGNSGDVVYLDGFNMFNDLGEYR